MLWHVGMPDDVVASVCSCFLSVIRGTMLF